MDTKTVVATDPGLRHPEPTEQSQLRDHHTAAPKAEDKREKPPLSYRTFFLFLEHDMNGPGVEIVRARRIHLQQKEQPREAESTGSSPRHLSSAAAAQSCSVARQDLPPSG